MTTGRLAQVHFGTVASAAARTFGRSALVAASAVTVALSCSSAADERSRTPREPAAAGSVAPVVTTTDVRPDEPPPGTSVPDGSSPNPVGPVDGGRVVIDFPQGGRAIDERVFGVNVPAWLGAGRFEDPGFIARAAESGATLIRMPGGSWSNGYRWEACEQRDDSRCYWPWAARPSDFVGLLDATGLPGLWTVSINETAQSAAAAVAFFNGRLGDETPIGVDRDGVDWGTVDRWAALRSAGGHPEPVGVQLWEVGNEVYGGRPDAGGDECASFGWEDVWTCDGREYVQGVVGHDGYLAIRSAMLAVDPTIEVGAVGVSDPSAWSGWGDEVIEESGDELDFYVVHTYGFNSSPSGDDAVARAADLWPDELGPVTERLGGTPLAVTEYNLVAMEAADTELTMTRAMNALFIADSLGQLVEHDVPIAAMWTLASGSCAPDCEPPWSGTDYGLVRVDTWEPLPTFEAFRAWSKAGTQRADAVIDGDVRLYPTRDDSGRVAVIAVNAGDAVTVPVIVRGAAAGAVASTSGVSAASLDAERMEPFDSDSLVLGPAGEIDVSLPPYSISVIEVGP